MRRGRPDSGLTLLELLVTLGIVGVLLAAALPMTANTLSYLRMSGGARSLFNAAQLAKMRAAATFTRSRLYIDRSANTFRVESLNLSGSTGWAVSGSASALATGVSWGYGSLTTAPPNTQTTIGLAPPCLTTAGVAIANTSCVLFNSRGIPIDSTGAPTGNQAIYIRDSTTIYAVTVSSSGLIQLWRSRPTTAAWLKQ